jgi:hypothetical protein
MLAMFSRPRVMKNTLRTFFSAAVLLPLLAVAGCGSGHTTVSVTLSPSGPQYIDAGQSATFTATVRNDPSNQGVTFQLLGAGTLTQTNPITASYTAPANATAAVTGSVIAVPVANIQAGASDAIFLAAAPAITTTTLPSTTVGAIYSVNIASTGGTAPNTFSITSGTLPAGFTLSATGNLSGSTTVPGTYTFTVGLTDSASTPVTATATYSLVVNPSALIISSGTLPTGVTTKTYSTTLVANGGTTPYTWALYSGNLPTGLSLSTAGVISGTPSATGNFTFTVQVTDSGTPTPQVVRKTLSISIVPLLVVTTTTLPNGALRNAYTATLTSTGGSGAITWSLVSGTLPAGLSLSTAGVISGTPTATGNSTFSVQAADSASPQQTATASLSLTIVLSTLAITTTSLPQVTVNTSYSQQLVSSGGNPPVTWSLATGSSPLPPGLTLSSTGLISGTPNTVGNYSFTVQATDTTPASVTQVLSINVVPLTTLAVTTATLPNGNIGAAYSTTLAGNGGATPYTWSLASGTLPAGLSLSTSGVISGTPYITGTSSFTVKVTDSQPTPATATRLLTLTIGTTLAAGANNSVLAGPYAFLINGFNTGSTSGAVYGFAAIGSLSFDGAGNITGIEDTNTPTGSQQSVAVTGSYTLGSDNRGFLVLKAGSVTTVYTIAAATVQFGLAQQITLAEYDNSTGTGANATGFAKRQTTTAFAAATLNASFSFGLSGESPCSTCAVPAPRFGPVAVAGYFTGSGGATIATGQEDASAYGQNFASVTIAGTFTAPSTTTGRGTLILTPAATIFSAPPVDYTYVIVSTTEVLLLSTDSHATFALLSGDALLQQNTPYATATSLSGRSIGYESQASGGDGSVTYPTALNAILYELTYVSSGVATLLTDANRAGTFTAGTAVSGTYATAASGRTTITAGTTSQVVYLDATGAGFGLDLAPTTGYPGLVQYELQVPASTTLPPLLVGSFDRGTLIAPVPAPTATGSATATLFNGGVNSGGIGGKITFTTDADTPAGAITYTQPSSFTYIEDPTGRAPSALGSGTANVMDAISGTRAVLIPTGAGPTPTVTVLQQ